MPVTPDKPAPYTSPAPVIDLMERHRSRGLPSPVDHDVLARAGVSPSLIPRTYQSLVALDLLDEKGNLTETFEGIRKAPESEYKKRVLEWLNATYADVLSFVDPAVDDERKVRDQFRAYKPVGQQERMVTLFLKLFAYAGVATKQAAPSAPRPRPATLKAKTGPARAHGGGERHDGARHTGAREMGLPAALTGLLQSLPREGEGWSQDRRDKFHQTFGAVLDFCFPIVEPEAASVNGNGD